MDITQNQTQNHEQIIKNLQDNFDQALGQKNQTPDILICSAGKAVSGAFENIPVADFQNQMDLHYFSCVLPVKAFIEGMKKRESGRICFVSSVGGQLGVWGFSAYSSSKFAVVGLAQVLSNELSPYNISVTVSYPPDMDTPGFQEEMKTKPWECNKISETGGLVTADFVAQKLFTDIQAGNFSASSNLDSWLSTVGSIGWSPSSSVLQTFCEVCFGGLIRLILLGYGKYFDYVSYQGKEMRKRGTYPKPNGLGGYSKFDRRNDQEISALNENIVPSPCRGLV